MPATLTLNDRVLTLTDEGESSSVDLSGIKGDIGIRGEQGEPGASAIDLENYYTKEEVENLIETTDTHYNAFWDAYQDNGNRSNYMYAFYGIGWNPTTYKPKYGFVSSNVAYMYATSLVDEIGELDMSTASNLNSTFNGCANLHTIKKLTMPGGSNVKNVNNTFKECAELTNVVFAGGWSTTGLTLQWSEKLTTESIISLFNILADVSASGELYELTIGEPNLAKLTCDEKRIAEQKGWVVY